MKEKIDYSKSIEILNLTGRTLNALRRGGIFSIEQLMNLTIPTMKKMNGIGNTMIEEVMNCQKSFLGENKCSNDKLKYPSVEKVAFKIYSYMRKHLYKSLGKCELLSNVKNIDEDILNEALNTLINNHKIEKMPDEHFEVNCRHIQDVIEDYEDEFYDELLSRNLEVLKQRLSGLTIDTVASNFGMSRTNVTLIAKKTLGKLVALSRRRTGIGVLKEDRYSLIYSKYVVPKEFLEQQLGLSICERSYLKVAYKRGNLNFKDALRDKSIGKEMHEKIKEYFEK